MIHRDRWLPHRRAVTVFAHVARLNVSATLAGCFDTVMTAYASAENVVVTEHRRNPCVRIVAVVALIAGCDMPRRFSRCLDVVVAGGTIADNGRVIHVRDSAPACRDMTARTLSAGVYVINRHRRRAHQATL